MRVYLRKNSIPADAVARDLGQCSGRQDQRGSRCEGEVA